MELEKHPYNKNFSWSVPNGPYSYLNSGQVESFSKDGFIILHKVFDADFMKKIISIIDPFEAQITENLKEFNEGKFFISRSEEITFTTHFVTQSKELKKFSKDKVFSSLCLDLIGKDVRLYWDQAVYKKGGTKDEFPWHQDNGYTFLEPQSYLTCWLALTDTDETNGCPWVVPKIHRQGTLKHKITDLGYEISLDSSQAIPIHLSAGSMAVFSSLTPHRTGPNITSQVRKAYILQYAPDGAVRKINDSVTELASEENRQFLIVEKGKSIN